MLSILVTLYLILFLIDIRLKLFVIKLFLKNLLCENISLIDVRHKKCAIKLLMLFYQHSYLLLICLLRIKFFKNQMILYFLMMIDLTTKTLILLHSLAMTWTLILRTLTILNLMMIVLMQTILKLLPLLGLKLGVIDKSNIKQVKNKRRINVYNITSSKSVVLECEKR